MSTHIYVYCIIFIIFIHVLLFIQYMYLVFVLSVHFHNGRRSCIDQHLIDCFDFYLLRCWPRLRRECVGQPIFIKIFAGVQRTHGFYSNQGRKSVPLGRNLGTLVNVNPWLRHKKSNVSHVPVVDSLTKLRPPAAVVVVQRSNELCLNLDQNSPCYL